jgi:hypothetical protein
VARIVTQDSGLKRDIAISFDMSGLLGDYDDPWVAVLSPAERYARCFRESVRRRVSAGSGIGTTCT